MKILQSTNPAKNYEVIGEVEISSLEDIKKAVEMAKTASKVWGELRVEKRVGLLRLLTSKLLECKEELAKLITNEVGKPIREARDEVDDTIEDIKYFLNKGPVYLADEIIEENKTTQSLVRHEPWGVAAVIAPWNWPLEMPEWGIIPNLISGNTVVFKPSEESPLTGQKFADLILKLNLPKGVFNIIHGASEVGEKLTDGDVNLIWFTGSSKVGQDIFAKAGKKFIKSVMELGGSSPAIVFEDVDIDDNLIESIYKGRFVNCGQACNAVKRLFVHKKNFDKVLDKLVKKVKSVKVGNPLEESTEIGSLVAKRQLELLESQVKDAINKGAKVEYGGKKPKELQGAYYMPTVLTNVTSEMRVLKEEVFGPVLPIIPFESTKEAIKIANDTEYGLTAKIYSSDLKLAQRIADQIKAGQIIINFPKEFSLESPFGGYKKSGMGREHGKWGFEELTQTKNIVIGKM